MHNINKVLSSVILYSILSYIFTLPSFATGVLFTIIGTQISMVLPKNYKYSLVVFVPLIAFSLEYPAVTVPLMIGFASSIFIRLLSKEGCKLLYPYKKTVFIGPSNYIDMDEKTEQATTVFLVVLLIISLAFTFYGTTIIDTVNQEHSFSSYIGSHGESYGNEDDGYIQYINIDPAECVNKNITTIKDENTTTTLISEYDPAEVE